MVTEAVEPLTPPDCDLRGLAFMPLDVVRLRESDLTAISTGDEFKAAVLLWCASWNQLPAASLPCDDRIIARLAGLSFKEWAAVKVTALRGWIMCSDGRLYHPTVAEKAVEAWRERQEHRAEKANETARKQRERDERRRMFETLRATGVVMPWNTTTGDLRKLLAERDHGSPVTRTVTPNNVTCHADRHAPDTAKTGTGTGTEEEEGANAPSGASASPSAPKRASSRKRQAGQPWLDDPIFAQAWDAASDAMRRRAKSKAKVWPEWAKVTATDPPEAILAALKRYRADDPDVERTGGPGLHLWLKDRTFEQWKTAALTEVIDDERWALVIRIWRESAEWSDRYGPPPGQPGCRAPPAMLLETASHRPGEAA